MQRQFNRLRLSHGDYWNRPVPPAGDPASPMLIIGLAPGMHGANKTGVPFTGDDSGQLLFRVLDELGLTARVRITNVLKCLPVRNSPATRELDNCRPFLETEISILEKQDNHVLFALGRVAHDRIRRIYGLGARACAFSHGAIHELPGNGWLIDSYHCSRYNTRTGRLTETMLRDAVAEAGRRSGLLA